MATARGGAARGGGAAAALGGFAVRCFSFFGDGVPMPSSTDGRGIAFFGAGTAGAAASVGVVKCVRSLRARRLPRRLGPSSA